MDKTSCTPPGSSKSTSSLPNLLDYIFGNESRTSTISVPNVTQQPQTQEQAKKVGNVIRVKVINETSFLSVRVECKLKGGLKEIALLNDDVPKGDYRSGSTSGASSEDGLLVYRIDDQTKLNQVTQFKTCVIGNNKLFTVFIKDNEIIITPSNNILIHSK